MRLAGIVCLLTVVASWVGNDTAIWAGERTLDAIRREVDEPAAPKSSHDDDQGGQPLFGINGRSQVGHHRPKAIFTFGPSSDSSEDDCESDDSDSLTAVALLFGVSAPWWLPYSILESEEEVFHGFPSAPYEDERDGYLVFDTTGIDEPAIDTKSWAGRVSFDTATNFDDLTTFTGRLRLDTASRLGLDAEWAHLSELLPGGDDWLGRGDCNLVVRFAQSPRAQFHSGVGITWLADRNDADVGFNFTYGVDLFPVDPVVTSATIDFGQIGNASMIHFRGTVGVMVLPQLHLYTGYDLLDFEGATIHSFLTGIEFWF